MFLERLIIRNFRAIEHADVSLVPGLNVLVGRNGSGKSTILAAIRILLDATLGRQARALDDGDIFGDKKFAGPANVVIAARFSGFAESALDKRLRLTFNAEGSAPSQWLLYRFRPRVQARTEIVDGVRDITSLQREDYESERSVRVAIDPNVIGWDTDCGGDDLKDKDLASIYITEIQALRDVVDELRRQRTSPLADLLTTIDVPKAERDAVEAAYTSAQKSVEGVTALAQISKAIEESYGLLSAESAIKLRLGLTRPGYAAIVQELNVLLTDEYVSDMELRRNGLGYNNLLFIAMLLERFRRRAEKEDGTPLLLVEEPEAHLHPQAQEALLRSIGSQPFQTIATTHSPYVAVVAGLDAIINLDRDDATKGIRLPAAAQIDAQEVADLERFLDANRGTMLFANKIVLVEGVAEQILIPRYASVLGLELAKLGIQVCSINGTHFGIFEKLLGPNGINRPYVIVRDGDAHNGPQRRKLPVFDDGRNVGARRDEFITATTLEYAITRPDSLAALSETSAELGMPETALALSTAAASGVVSGDLQRTVLGAASRAGKGRFAQSFGAKIARDQLTTPDYISAALKRVAG